MRILKMTAWYTMVSGLPPPLTTFVVKRIWVCSALRQSHRTAGNRGLGSGRIWTEAGALAVTFSQEGLIRLKDGAFSAKL